LYLAAEQRHDITSRAGVRIREEPEARGTIFEEIDGKNCGPVRPEAAFQNVQPFSRQVRQPITGHQ